MADADAPAIALTVLVLNIPSRAPSDGSRIGAVAQLPGEAAAERATKSVTSGQ